MESKFPLQEWIERKQLVKIVAVKQKVGRRVIMGRILSYDKEMGAILLYDDDQKEVVHLLQNEIDSIEKTYI
ncbi:hypothetical protein [Halalkalibacter nanhaiisediminis]|uniref:YolD-like protein n=1 Tax=Halalkalibacter nanhaiisediminis TaxID=688079 RepID=A0A562QK93_9BACI|nr:hypothetical protein [Halalkalibacter nanhaiisediminis]TWI57144.1 hypothetical protein IQ10_01848 [Halalkalibacter nanhaiisediminis]